ncbi:hypothetical protein EIP86_010220 [Pleurotus ostreatoroseus]|nr:hypothetical protein EIP86_010220 [Pleurotus ostreatoroseus]
MSSALSDTTASPAPFSPFSTYPDEVHSDTTSDGACHSRDLLYRNLLTVDHAEPPDLGAFTTVFRALTTFNHPRAHHLERLDSSEATPTSAWISASENESEAAGGSTVWTHGLIASYLQPSSPEVPLEGTSPTDTESGVELSAGGIRQKGGGVLVLDTSEVGDPDDPDQPSLGLAGALDFLAAERAKFVAQREGGYRGHSSNTSDGTWRHVVPHRRKRRRKRNRSAHPAPGEASVETAGEDENQDGEANTASQDDADDSSFSSDEAYPSNYYESTPASPPNARDQRTYQTVTEEGRLQIHHSKSTPSLRLPVTMPIDARVLQLRNLAHKLRMLFPKDAAALSAILSHDHPDASDFVDPRGPAPRVKDTLIHVFIDHSNILIGFLSYLRRNMHRINRKSKHLSHAALALILERGRPVTRRVLTTSSPLYQPVDSAEQLGYEVHVLQRVPDDGEGADRQQHGSSSSGGEGSRLQYTPQKATSHRRGQSRGHAHKASLGGVSTGESDGNNSSAVPTRIRYREQGVDELLQLKLHQALASADVVPQDATIVLATGDGNVGQFNEEGFLGCVRLALKKGWHVELYAWEGGLSKAWKREFGSNKKFEIHMLDRFAMDLLEL